MAVFRLTLCIVVGLLAVGCGGVKSGTANPLAPRTYLEHGLALMRSNAVYTPTVGWSAVEAEAIKMAASAKTTAGTYAALDYAIARLQQAGDGHAVFSNPAEAKIAQQRHHAWVVHSTVPPTVSLAEFGARASAPRIGLIVLPAIGSLPKTPGAGHYAASALARISSLQRSQHACGWIVDLRDNSGGDMYPMLLAVGPILGSGTLIGFTNKTGKTVAWVSYRNNTLSSRARGDVYTVRAPARIPDFRPAVAVAVLTGQNTASAAEAVAIAFRGRPHTRSFGATTAGATNSPNEYRLADGATIGFSTTLDTDRHGHVYRHAITPDVPVTNVGVADRVALVATRWLKTTTACTPHR